jgi:hypothetical protein
MKNLKIDDEIEKILSELEKQKSNLSRELPKINKKIKCLSSKDLDLSLEEIKQKIKDYDYVYFIDQNCKNLDYRESMQAYSLEKTKKPISCCNYYANSRGLGDYLLFLGEFAYRRMNKEDFFPFLNINQFMFKKDYLLKNFEKIKNSNTIIDFVDNKNTAFVSFPLIRLKNITVKEHEMMKRVFAFNFLYQLYSLKARKKLLTSPFVYALLLETIKGKGFMLKAIFETLKDKDKRKKLNTFKKI